MNKLGANRALFAIGDPGAAKAVLALVHKLSKNELNEFRIISDQRHSFYEDFGLEVEITGSDDLHDIIESYTPEYLFTGTSHSSSFEWSCVRIAKQENISTFSFVDHWTSFAERFHHKGATCYPDHVLVIDERAAELAKNAGIPADLVEVFDNPYYEFLRMWTPSQSKADFLQNLGLNSWKGRIISLMAEPLSIVGGITKYGTDEYQCLSILFKAVHSLQRADLLLLIKNHPHQDAERMREEALNLSREHDVEYKFVDTDINEILSFSDLIIGIFSNALIEAKVLNKPIIRILKDLSIADPLAGMHIGEPVYSESDLEKAIKSNL